MKERNSSCDVKVSAPEIPVLLPFHNSSMSLPDVICIRLLGRARQVSRSGPVDSRRSGGTRFSTFREDVRPIPSARSRPSPRARTGYFPRRTWPERAGCPRSVFGTPGEGPTAECENASGGGLVRGRPPANQWNYDTEIRADSLIILRNFSFLYRPSVTAFCLSIQQFRTITEYLTALSYFQIRCKTGISQVAVLPLPPSPAATEMHLLLCLLVDQSKNGIS